MRLQNHSATPQVVGARREEPRPAPSTHHISACFLTLRKQVSRSYNARDDPRDNQSEQQKKAISSACTPPESAQLKRYTSGIKQTQLQPQKSRPSYSGEKNRPHYIQPQKSRQCQLLAC